MADITPLASLVVPWGRQLVELEEIRYDPAGAPLLRVRIREGKRFTIFDIDAVTAARWAEAMGAWAGAQAVDGAALSGQPACATSSPGEGERSLGRPGAALTGEGA